MALTIESIQFKRGTQANLMAWTGILLQGEPAWEIDTGKVKVGNGVGLYKDLPYTGDSYLIYGYYFNKKFWVDSTYQVECDKNPKVLYVNLNYKLEGELPLYYYDNAETDPNKQYKPLYGQATESVPGLVKLYDEPGQNVDGTMTQKCITDGVNAIKFAIEQADTDDDGDGNLENVLILDLPWD